MGLPRFSRRELAFLLVTPLAWAVLLLFHAAVGDPVYDSLADDRTAFLVVHLGMLVFIGLIGGALYLLVRDLPGTGATIARLPGPTLRRARRGTAAATTTATSGDTRPATRY
jgi:hypothetical protein